MRKNFNEMQKDLTYSPPLSMLTSPVEPPETLAMRTALSGATAKEGGSLEGVEAADLRSIMQALDG
jgi:hypothetical protein